MRNKPNLPELVRVISAGERNGYGNLRRSVGREKQSQFRPTGHRDSRSIGGSRARTPNPRRVAGAPIVRNKANWGRSFKFEVSSVKTGKAVVGTSHFLLRTSNSAEGRSYKRSQFWGAGRREGSGVRHRLARPPFRGRELTVDRAGVSY
jgi:hypothetical protein